MGFPQLPHSSVLCSVGWMPAPPTGGELPSAAGGSPSLTSIPSLQKLHLGRFASCTSYNLLVPPATTNYLHRSSTRDHKLTTIGPALAICHSSAFLLPRQHSLPPGLKDPELELVCLGFFEKAGAPRHCRNKNLVAIIIDCPHNADRIKAVLMTGKKL